MRSRKAWQEAEREERGKSRMCSETRESTLNQRKGQLSYVPVTHVLKTAIPQMWLLLEMESLKS